MANFKVKFVTDGDANLINTTNCCEPKVFNVKCSDLKLGQEYDLTLVNDSNDFQSKIFPKKYTFTATTSLRKINIVNAGLYNDEPKVILEGGDPNIKARISIVTNNINNKYSILEVNVDSVGDGYKSLPTIKVVGDAVVPAILTAELLPIDKYVTFLTSFVCDANNVPQVQT